MFPLYNWPEWRWSRPGRSRGGDASKPPHQAQSGSSWQETQTAASCEYCNYRLSSAFYTPHCSRMIDYPFTYTTSPCLVWKDMLNMHALLPGTLCLTFMHSHLLAAEWQHAVSSALWHKTHSTRRTALINCHIWVCLTDNVTKPLHSRFFCCFSSAFTCKVFSNQCVKKRDSSTQQSMHILSLNMKCSLNFLHPPHFPCYYHFAYSWN